MALADIYQKTGSDKVLVVNARCSTTRQFNFGPWTEIRLGFYIGCTTTGGDNVDVNFDESVTWNGPTDSFYIGIRNSSSTAFPFSSGCQFIGIVPPNYLADGTGRAFEQYNAFPFNAIGNTLGGNLAIALNGSTVVGGGVNPTSAAMDNIVTPLATATTTYNGYVSMRFVVANAGLSTQTVSLSTYVTNSGFQGPPYTTDALRAALLSATFGTAKTLTWNSGGVALPLPDSVYIYFPFYNIRLRYSALEFIKMA